MQHITEISLKNYFNSLTLNTRDEAEGLFNYLNSQHTPNIILDFAGIDFISRSFAHEFYKNELAWAERYNKAIELNNTSDEIDQMFKAIASTFNKPLASSKNVPVIQFTDIREIYQYLVAV